MILALLLATLCTPLPTCTRPPTITPCDEPPVVLEWDPNPPAENIDSYQVYASDPGGTPKLIVQLPCEIDQDGVTRICRGIEIGAPMLRYCDGCLPGHLYELRVKACNVTGICSPGFSNMVLACFHPTCAKPGPCD